MNLGTNYSDEMRTKPGRGPIPPNETLDSRFLVDQRAEYLLFGRFKIWGQVFNATDEVYVAARRPAGLRPGRPRSALFGISFSPTIDQRPANPERRPGRFWNPCLS